MKKIICSVFIPIVLSLSMIGCATSKDLAPNGVYHGDAYLYNIDSSIVASYDVVDAFLLWELQNNDYIKTNSPAIFNVANTIRSNASTALKDVGIARQYYIKFFGNTNELANFVSASNTLASATATLATQANVVQSAALPAVLSEQYTNILKTVTASNTINSILK